MPVAMTVDEMISVLPAGERKMTERLRHLIMECLPQAIEKPYYGLGIPFYSHHRQICYIMPVSAMCGIEEPKEHLKGTVSLCFCQGNRMANEDGRLKSEGRKQVHAMYFKSLREIDDAEVCALLYEASMIDESFVHR